MLILKILFDLILLALCIAFPPLILVIVLFAIILGVLGSIGE